ncbi:arabinosyltransferase domain-containing protein [Actinomycetospora endophytica]|uniref:Arabinosyltransferase domain-containing protein n=1 Tax=Actinomycetospora endophytica TaxID=2291215 RepID=A0ABS8P513_9PSEU|nr:arabinosyltransferase domain-containing protein [Actinomycetospora endophytica]MCD2193347.1 arabinosyltransferase domain-containing protein [Actinomycetospora endophytica]
MVSVLAALAFPFAPVSRPDVTYSWPAAGTTSPAPAAIPMLPYQPVTTTASVSCEAARAVAPGTVLLSTTAPRPDPLAEQLQGLTMTAGPAAGAVAVSVGGHEVGPVTLPGGACSLRLDSGIDATTVTVDSPGAGSRQVARLEGDQRPAVAGAFTGAPTSAGVSLSVVGDTRFQNSAGGLKIALGALAVAAFAVALGAVVVGARRRRRVSDAAPQTLDVSDSTSSSRRSARPARLVDVGVVLGLLLWQVIGPLTVDDGYIAGIVRSLGQNGQIGTVFRWLNSPETPFGWFYEVLAVIAGVDPAPFWLRLPATALGITGWVLLSRAVLPRMGLQCLPRLVPWLAGTVYLAWWLPYDLGVRPESWVLVGSTAVYVLTERAVERRSVTPLVVALLVAGITLAVTPTGLMAFAPLLAAVVPLVRLVRADPLGVVTFAVVGIAALGLTLVLVYADQTWASVLDSVGIRTLIGGDRPWTDEYVRYTSLLTVGDADGNLGRRAPVLLLALAFGALVFARMPRPAAAHRLVVTTLLSFVTLAFTPTKWTHHFGAFAVLGTATTLLALDAWLRAPVDAERAPRRAAWAVALAAGASGLTLAGYNQWHWISSYAITWSTNAPTLRGIRLSDLVLVLGVVLAVALAVLAIRRTLRRESGDPDVQRQRRRIAVTDTRLLALAPALAITVVAVVVAIEVLTFAHTAIQRRDSYTLASDSVASLQGRSCGIADRLRVEPDPLAGLLPADGPGPAPTAAPDGPSMAGATLPAWRGPGVTTGWFGLPGPSAPTGKDAPGPVVVTLTGPVAHGDVTAEFGTRDPSGAFVPGAQVKIDESATQYSSSASVDAPRSRDLRLDPALSARWNAVRLVSSAQTPVFQGFSAPRIARLVPWNQVLPPGTPAAVDWPGAFLFPCTPFTPLRDGLATLPGWRVSTDARSEAQSGYISYTASQGGPWTTARSLVRQVRYPVYLPGLPLTDIASLERWVPTSPVVAPTVTRHDVGHSGFSTPGPLAVGDN